MQDHLAMNRLIPKESLPNSLWNKRDATLSLPPQLVSNWKALLIKYQLMDRAVQKAPKGFVGGMSKEDTDNHLAWRFTGSAARVMLSILDPHEEMIEISDAFARIFSGNKVLLADLPCGSGAGSISILSVFCELRKQGRIPRMPLEIIIVGGEISGYARDYACEAINALQTDLEDQAIEVSFEAMNWDVCDRFSNTDLIKRLTVKSQACSGRLVLLANFSGFLQRNGKWKDASKQFDELFRHCRDENSTALWIEPNTNAVTNNSGSFMPRLIQWFRDKFSFVQPWKKADDEHTYAKSEAEVKHPLNEGKFKTKLVVFRFDLPKNANS